MPMYQKKGDPDTWLDMCKTKAGLWRWYVKPAKEKGSGSSVCFGYGVSGDIVFPHECDAKSWYCYDGKGFEKEEGIVVSLLPGTSMPASVLAMKDVRQQEWLADKTDKTAQVLILLFLLLFTLLIYVLYCI
jgi:hypothetical protein